MNELLRRRIGREGISLSIIILILTQAWYFIVFKRKFLTSLKDSTFSIESRQCLVECQFRHSVYKTTFCILFPQIVQGYFNLATAFIFEKMGEGGCI